MLKVDWGQVNKREIEGWRIFVNILWTTFHSMCLFCLTISCNTATISYLFFAKSTEFYLCYSSKKVLGIACNLTTMVISLLRKKYGTNSKQENPESTFETQPVGKSRLLAICIGK